MVTLSGAKIILGQIKEIVNQCRCRDDWIKVLAEKVHKKGEVLSLLVYMLRTDIRLRPF